MPEVGRERGACGLHALPGLRLGWPASGPIGDGRWGDARGVAVLARRVVLRRLKLALTNDTASCDSKN